MWLVKNKKGEVVHEVKASRFKTAIHKAACISGGTIEASSGCTLPVSPEELNSTIQDRRDEYNTSRHLSHNAKIAKSGSVRWPQRRSPDMEKVTSYLQSRGMGPKNI